MSQLSKVYRLSCIATAALFLYLSYSLVLNGESFLLGLGINPNEATFVVAKRAGALMLGFSLLMFLARNIIDRNVRRLVSAPLVLTMLFLALLGGFELARGTVGEGILTAIVIETMIALVFIGVWFAEHRLSKHP